MEIDTVGLFGLTLERPYALISFELKPKVDNYLGKWVEVEYEGLSGKSSRKLSFDEANGAFYFPPTQIRLDSSPWMYPFNTYRVQFTLSGENVSFSGSGEKITDTPVLLLRSKIKWENNTLSVEMGRELHYSFFQSAIIFSLFLVILKCSMSTIKRTLGGFFISFATALGFVYLILTGLNMELMPIFSPIFWGLFGLGAWCFRKPLLMKLSKIRKSLKSALQHFFIP